MRARFLPCYGEWFYGRSGGVEPSVIVERYLEADSEGGLDDYKVFVMNGKAVLTLVCSGRTADAHYEDCYDMEWNLMEGFDMGEERSGKAIAKPACFNDMIAAAERLAAPFNHARVDFYIVKEKLIFGEITFTSGSGFDRFHPYEFDLELGGKLKLPCDEVA